MLNAYPRLSETAEPGPIPSSAVWVDLLNADDDEIHAVESMIGVRLPSRGELSEIEVSSRLRAERGVLYLSTPMMSQAESEEPFLSPVGFVLTPFVLVTVRFDRFKSFQTAVETVESLHRSCDAMGAFTLLMEAVIDRQADLLERCGSEMTELSRSVFAARSVDSRQGQRSTLAHKRLLVSLGRLGDRLSELRAVLLGLGRITSFVVEIAQKRRAAAMEQGASPPNSAPASGEGDYDSRLLAAKQDIQSLIDYETHLTDKVQFLLDAVLGLINIQQNDIFKVLTIASVVGIPPTLVASIYGMNFANMPELHWNLGYPFGLALIVVTTLLPIAWFKWRGWF